MAEIKNSFTSSKMNQDLDDRLVPPNEYRDARNISIISSSDSNTGAIENILGNELVSDLILNINSVNFEIIGYTYNLTTGILYVMATNYTDTSPTQLDNHQIGSNTISRIVQVNLNSKAVQTLVDGEFLNFSKTHPITGINLVENLLFWTDNRNQPRKINVNTAFNNNSYYVSEDSISVAKYAPFSSIEFLNEGICTMKDVTSKDLPNGEPNPDYIENYAGDPNYLSDKFVRFSYRFRFDDGEYSILAPFSQIAFIPRQDGSFIDGDEDEAYRSSIVTFMKNKVTQIGLIIPLPTFGSNLFDEFKVIEIDIIYKESEGLAIQILDTIPEGAFSISTEKYYNYTYQSRKPKATLSNDQLLRVYDKVPVRALAQETVGNRIIYGNYIDKHTPPDFINYKVSITPKADDGDILKEYPLHTVKQNRTYQVGIVLSDRFGRQSDVILSPVEDGLLAAGIFYGGSSLYSPYTKNIDFNVLSFFGNSIKVLFEDFITSTREPLNDFGIPATGEPGLYSLENPTGWYSYKIVVKQTEQEYYNVYVPGALSGYPLPAVDFPIDEDAKTSNIVLFSDNINKVPRDLSEVGPDQKQYRSSVKLFGRVENNSATSNAQFIPTKEGFSVPALANALDLKMGVADINPSSNFYQLNTNPIIGRISTNGTSFGTTATTMLPYLAVLETSPITSNIDLYWETSTTGLISELNELIGGGVEGAYSFLNINYRQFEDQNPNGGNQDDTGDSDCKFVTDWFYPVTYASATLSSTEVTSFSVKNLNNNPISGFELVTEERDGINKYRIKITENFYYNTNINLNIFNFTLNVFDPLSNTTNSLVIKEKRIQNINPKITEYKLNPVNAGAPPPYQITNTVTGVNGSFGSTATSTVTSDLKWSFADGTQIYNAGSGANSFVLSINQNTGHLSLSSGNPIISVTFTVVLTDSGNAIDAKNITLSFSPGEFNPTQFKESFNI